MISGLAFLAALFLCILWPSAFLSKTLHAPESTPRDRRANGRWLGLARIWTGTNALVGLLFLVIVLGEAATLDLWLNSGHVRPFYPACYKMIASWVLTVLTFGSVVFSVSFWSTRSCSKLAGGFISVVVLVSLYVVLSLQYLGLLFFTS